MKDLPRLISLIADKIEDGTLFRAGLYRPIEIAGFIRVAGEAISELNFLTKIHRLDEWHVDYGSVLWWRLPIDEEPYIGTPLDSDWPGYHTHWSRLPSPLI